MASLGLQAKSMGTSRMSFVAFQDMTNFVNTDIEKEVGCGCNNVTAEIQYRIFGNPKVYT